MAARIFVSCGQATTEERDTAAAVRTWLESQGFEVFVALETQSLSDINSGTIGHLRQADYYLFIDFPREQLLWPGEKLIDQPRHRGSLFSHQELALAYLLDFPNAVFLRHRDVELKGIAQFQMGNAETFADYTDVLKIVQQQITARAWRPNYTRHLLAVDIQWPNSPTPYDSFGNRRSYWVFYATIANRRTDTAALNVIGRLVRIINSKGEECHVIDQSRLYWGGHGAFECTIFPGDSESIAILALDRDENRRVYLHSARDISPQHPILNLPGTYRLRYQLVAADFPLHEFEVAFQHTANIDTTSVKIVSA